MADWYEPCKKCGGGGINWNIGAGMPCNCKYPQKHLYLWTAQNPDEWPIHAKQCWCWTVNGSSSEF
jgi:hypothetical protein